MTTGDVARTASVILVGAMVSAPAFAGKRLEGIPLIWKPTDLKKAGVVNLTDIVDVRVQMEPLVDTRADKTKFGENQEDSVFKPVTTSGSAAEFCTQHLGNTMRQLGFSVVPEGGDVVLGGEVLEFMVIETNTYKGEVRLKVALKRKDKTEWTGVTSGESRRFGRSYKAENYYETISDSLLHAIQALAQDEGFHQALSGR